MISNLKKTTEKKHKMAPFGVIQVSGSPQNSTLKNRGDLHPFKQTFIVACKLKTYQSEVGARIPVV